MFSQKKINSTIANWLEFLLEFNFKVVHCPGILHVIPNALSRFYDNDNPDCLNQENALMKLSAATLLIHDFEGEGSLETIKDREQQVLLMDKAHALGHFGAKAMMNSIRSNGYNWKGIRDQCQSVVQKCLPCQRFNIGKHEFHPLKNMERCGPRI
jgi:hypothetical protein